MSKLLLFLTSLYFHFQYRSTFSKKLCLFQRSIFPRFNLFYLQIIQLKPSTVDVLNKYQVLSRFHFLQKLQLFSARWLKEKMRFAVNWLNLNLILKINYSLFYIFFSFFNCMQSLYSLSNMEQCRTEQTVCHEFRAIPHHKSLIPLKTYQLGNPSDLSLL